MAADIRPLNTDVRDSDEELERRWKKHKKNKRRAVIIAVIAIVVIAIAAFLIQRLSRFTSAELVSEKSLNEGSLVGIVRYADNALKYSHDGASYFNADGKDMWIDSYEMRVPKAYVSGDYACIADIGGTKINIYDRDGLCGTTETLLPITKAVVSQTGICAAVTEDSLACYIVFFQKDGSSIDITIKSVLNDDGYPVDISLSPDGTQLIVANSFISGPQMKSRVVFYDFSEIGKNIPNRLVGGFEEPFENSMLARVKFINSTYSYAVSENAICFFSSKNLASPELIKQIEVSGEIEKIFNSGEDLGVITNEESGKKLTVYKENGTKAMELDIDFDFSLVSGDGKYIYFTGKNGCSIYNMHGVKKYSADIPDDARVIIKGKLPGRFLFTSGSYIREYQFR